MPHRPREPQCMHATARPSWTSIAPTPGPSRLLVGGVEGGGRREGGGEGRDGKEERQ